MSHIHIPDGVLPLWLVGAGWVLAVALLALITRRLSAADSSRQLPLLGVMSAVMLVGMSTELVPIAYHVNLSVLAGIVLGPGLVFVAALAVNLILAMFGHGGITVVGLNSLVLAAEAALGYYLFRWAWSLLRTRRQTPALAAGIATAFALLLSSLLMVGIVGLSDVGPSAQARALPEDLSFQNPFEHGLVASSWAGADVHEGEGGAASQGVDIVAFAKLVVLFGSIGWAIEALLTGAIVGFVYRVRPDLVGGRSRAEAHSQTRVS